MSQNIRLDDGNWYTYAEVRTEIASLEAENERLREIIKDLDNACNRFGLNSLTVAACVGLLRAEAGKYDALRSEVEGRKE